jgi:hypothetical protein
MKVTTLSFEQCIEAKRKLSDFFNDFIVENGCLYGIKNNSTILVGIINYN